MPRRGDRLGAYVIERPIGEGASAIVYAASHDRLQRRVAIKVLLPSHAGTDLAQRFVRESRATAKLEHPHVVDVIDVGTTDAGSPYMIMELLEGEDLERYLRRMGRLGVQEAVDLLVPVMAGIAAAHGSGIVHRDLKPQNVFLSVQGKLRVPKVLDFGISKVIDQDAFGLTGTKALLGTPFYMSPEQAQAKRTVDARSDIFALGVMLYECVTGKKPFVGESLYELLNGIVTTPYQPLQESVPDAPDALCDALELALKKNPDERFSSMREFARALLPLSSQRTRALYATELDVHMESMARAVPVRASRSRPSGSNGRTLRPSHRALSVAASCALLVSLAGGVWLASDRTKTPQRESAEALEDTTRGAENDAARALAVAAAPPVEVGQGAPLSPEALRERRDKIGTRYEVLVSIDPPHATIVLDGHRMATSKLVAAFKADGTTHVLEASANGYRSASVVFQDAPPPTRIQLEKLSVAKSTSTAPATSGEKPLKERLGPQWKPDPFESPTTPTPTPTPRRPLIEQPY